MSSCRPSRATKRWRRATRFVARVDLGASAAKVPLDHVVILVDTSASRAPIMGRQAEVLEQLIANLPDDAQVTVVAFDQDVTELYRGAARDAGERRRRRCNDTARSAPRTSAARSRWPRPRVHRA